MTQGNGPLVMAAAPRSLEEPATNLNFAVSAFKIQTQGYRRQGLLHASVLPRLTHSSWADRQERGGVTPIWQTRQWTPAVESANADWQTFGSERNHEQKRNVDGTTRSAHSSTRKPHALWGSCYGLRRFVETALQILTPTQCWQIDASCRRAIEEVMSRMDDVVPHAAYHSALLEQANLILSMVNAKSAGAR